jgi:type II secretory pathway pseudopilin PulG
MEKILFKKLFVILIIIILLAWAVTSTVLWKDASRENRSNRQHLMNDFHGALLVYHSKLGDLSEIVEVSGEQADYSQQEQRLMNAIVDGLLGDLGNVWARINEMGVRITPEYEEFRSDYSIQALLGIIHNIQVNAGETFGNGATVDRDELERMEVFLSGTSYKLNFIYILPLDSDDFREELKQYVDTAFSYPVYGVSS